MLHDLRYAIRTFLKTPGFTILAILVLAIGIGANSAMFTLVNTMMFKPLSGEADRLVGLFSRDRTRPDEYRAFSYPNYADIRSETADIFDGLMAQTFAMIGISAGDTTKRAFASVVSSNYFDTLGVLLAAGRSFSADEERPGARIPVVVVGYGHWKEAGLDPAFVNRQMRINGLDFTIIGVTPQGFSGTMAMAAPEVWLPAWNVRHRRERHVQEPRHRARRSRQPGTLSCRPSEVRCGGVGRRRADCNRGTPARGAISG